MDLDNNDKLIKENNKSFGLAEKQSDRVNAIHLDRLTLSRKNPNNFHSIVYQTSANDSKTRIDLFTNDCGEKWTIAKLKDELFLHLLSIGSIGKGNMKYRQKV